MDELWLPVIGWEGLYEVSNLGRVRSLDVMHSVSASDQQQEYKRFRRGRILKHNLDKKRYHTVHLYRPEGTKRCKVHRLVLLAFIGPPPADKPLALHGPNGNQDNSLPNLYWGDNSRNVGEDRHRDGTFFNPVIRGSKNANAKLTEEEVRAIRSDPRLQRVIAEDYGITREHVGQIKRRQQWAHLS